MNVKKDYSNSIEGIDELTNLRAICSVCNEGASNVTLQRPDLSKLLVQVRRATANDQRVLLDWLKKKFDR
jgi:thymidine kinase